MGKNAGYTEEQIRAEERAIIDQGITMQAARQSMALMFQAQIDLAHGADLARAAQDAAVIANINSSEAFERLVYVIQTGNVRMARTLGFVIEFQEAYKKWAEANDRTVESLTAQEKVMIRTDAVLEFSTHLYGTYEAAMETAGKRILSLDRHWEESRRILGERFLPILKATVIGIEDLLVAWEDMDEVTQSGIASMIGAGTAMAGVNGILFLLLANLGKLKGAAKTASLAMGGMGGAIMGVTAIVGLAVIAVAKYYGELAQLREMEIELRKEAIGNRNTYREYVQTIEEVAKANGLVAMTQEAVDDALRRSRTGTIDLTNVLTYASDATYAAIQATKDLTEFEGNRARNLSIVISAEEAAERAAKQHAAALEELETQLGSIGQAFEDLGALTSIGFTQGFEDAQAAIEENTTRAEELRQEIEELSRPRYLTEDQREQLDRLYRKLDKGRGNAERLRRKIADIESQRYLSDKQKEELTGLRKELFETEGDITDIEKAWDKQTKTMLFNMAMQRAEMLGISEEAYPLVLDMAESWGLIDHAGRVAMENVDEALLMMARGEGIQAARGELMQVQQQLSDLEGTYYIDVQLSVNRELIQRGGGGRPGFVGPDLEGTDTGPGSTVHETPVGGVQEGFQAGGKLPIGRSWALVGERGPEMVSPGGQVFPIEKKRDAPEDMPPVQVIIQGGTFMGEFDFQRAVQDAMREALQ